jgi:hypothetical protein
MRFGLFERGLHKIDEISQTLMDLVSDYLDGVKIAVRENHSGRERNRSRRYPA